VFAIGSTRRASQKKIATVCGVRGERMLVYKGTFEDGGIPIEKGDKKSIDDESEEV
jgi:hypothetical protein